MKYSEGTGERKNWIVTESEFDPRYLGKCEAIFSQGNGYIGLRAALEESYVGETRNMFVTGTFNKFDETEVTELPNLPDLTNLEIVIDGHPFSLQDGEILSYRRELDLYTGEILRRVNWRSKNGKRFLFSFRRFVSRDDEHRIGFCVTLTAEDADADIRVTSGINGRVSNSGSQHFHEGDKRLFENTILRMCSTTTKSDVICGLYAVHNYKLDGQQIEPKLLPIIDRRYMATAATVSISAGQTLTIEKVCVVYTTRDRAYINFMGDCAAQMQKDGYADISEIKEMFKLGLGYEALLAQSAAAWAAYWADADIRIDGDDYSQLAIRFALYHLNSMVKADDDRVGIAAKGLSGEGYKGHSFWDTEIFILPHFILTQPRTARTLLTYRYHGLEGARRKAKENGYQGAMYPWEAAWSSDGEVTPLWGAADVVTGLPMRILTGQIEQHITADIAFAVWQYFQATDDQSFLDEYGYEIILDTARFWASRSEWDAENQRFVITDVIGPDEYKEHVNNNAYTNYMAHNNMTLALRVIEELTARGSELYTRLNAQFDFEKLRIEIKTVVEKLYLPKPGADGVIPQFDGYFDLKHIDLTPYKNNDVVGTIYNDYNIEQISGLQVSKQTDTLMLLFLMEDLFSADVKEKNYKHYEERTLHDSSLSKSTHCVLACDLGLDDIAYRFFRGACDIDLGPIMTTSDMGIHSASMGGIWQGTVYGFGGVRIVSGMLRIAPRLPVSWERLSFPIIWRNARLVVEATKNDLCIHNRSDKEVAANLYGDEFVLKPNSTTHVPRP